MKKNAQKKPIKLEHIERLSHGKRSGINAGSRAVGHYLRPHERATYQRALKRGFLEITEQDRANLWHIWEKACEAQDIAFLVLIKDIQRGVGTIYQQGELLKELDLAESKKHIKQLLNQ